MVYLPFVTRETLTRPGLLLGLAILGSGVALTLLDELVGILLLGVGLFWFGAMMRSQAATSNGAMRQ